MLTDKQKERVARHLAALLASGPDDRIYHVDIDRWIAEVKEAIDLQEKPEQGRISELESALRSIIRHWREFGGMMVFNNATNKDDYGLDERIDAAEHVLNKTL